MSSQGSSFAADLAQALGMDPMPEASPWFVSEPSPADLVAPAGDAPDDDMPEQSPIDLDGPPEVGSRQMDG